MIPREVLKQIRQIEIRTNFLLLSKFSTACALLLTAAVLVGCQSLKPQNSCPLNLKIPERTYFVGADQIASGKLLSAAKAGLNGFSGDRFDSAITEALRLADQLPQTRTRDYQPRLLNVPSIYFVAVWLHGEFDDIIIPLPPTFERLKAYQAYSENQIIKLLMPEAKKALNEPNLIR